MKKGLLGSTALVGASLLMAGAAGAAEAPSWKLSGNMNFQLYWVDQDNDSVRFIETSGSVVTNSSVYVWGTDGTDADFTMPLNIQDHGWYFGVDSAELVLNVDGTADNGLKYGFKIELDANTSGSVNADEARIQFSGSWGTLQLGDEDGAEDVMNYGGEDLMGATGGFDGDFDDVLLRVTQTKVTNYETKLAPSYPTIAGDSGDLTKISYFSPRFSGFQVGASLTPTPNTGDGFKADGNWENHYGLGANYDNTFGSVHVQASAVYSAASSNNTGIEDVAAWSLGGIVGWGPFSLGANYTDNGDSGSPASTFLAWESSYWDVAASYETGPFTVAAGYFSSIKEFSGTDCLFAPTNCQDSTFENFALTADYAAAPGLGFYAEIDMISDEVKGSNGFFGPEPGMSSDATVFIMGANVSF